MMRDICMYDAFVRMMRDIYRHDAWPCASEEWDDLKVCFFCDQHDDTLCPFPCAVAPFLCMGRSEDLSFVNKF